MKNQKLFAAVMTAIDDDLLEEAMRPAVRRKASVWRPVLAAAACLAVVVGVTALRGGGRSKASADTSAAAGTVAEEPAAFNSFAASLESGSAAPEEAPAETFDACERETADISEASKDKVTPVNILLDAGFILPEVPQGGTGAGYDLIEQDGLTVAEMSFTLDGTRYVYRMAATGEIAENFRDISALQGTWADQDHGQIGWCNARLYWDEGGSGKAVWFDIVPGILYSLTMDTAASEQGLLDMARILWQPAQGDVG